MRLTLIQSDIIWADKKANLKYVEAFLKDLKGQTDLVVLPEMFSTGFCTNQIELAEPMDGETVTSLKKWAKVYDLAITGSFIASENGKIYNRTFFVFPTGEIRTADKRHLFSMGDEHTFFTSGNERMIVNYCGFNICVLVCYDLRFPVWSRNVNNEYDLLIYTANWPESRIKVWDALLTARALENQAYVCGVNRVGEDGSGLKHNGCSQIINQRGEKIFQAQLNQTHIETVRFDIKELNDFRNKFPVWKDADTFDIRK